MIRQLSAAVSEKIAAGEVIERPASIVKELVENSLDAGASQVAVILDDGGRELIEVVDNGHGMGPTDLKLSVCRHATSKLTEMADLETLQTLGFRGEALASVLAVSADLRIISATADQSAHQYHQGEVEKIAFGHFLGSDYGTTIQARGLFAEIPARLKFLKTARAEIMAVRDWIERLGLSRPDVEFRLVHNDREVLHLRKLSAEARCHEILTGGDASYPVRTAEMKQKEYELSGRIDWMQGLSLPNTRKIYQLVNGRSLRDRLIQQAMLSAFKQTFLPGNFPAAVMRLNLPPHLMDVNVHPTKTEVRFHDSQRIFRFVEKLTRSLLLEHGAPSFATARPLAPPPEQQAGWSLAEPLPQLTPEEDRPPLEVAPAPSRPTPSHPFLDSRYVGSLFETYLLFDQGSGALILDQHAAHERIRYEELRKQYLEKGSIEQQQLLLPESIDVEPEELTLLLERAPLFQKSGFQVERFGERTLLFRAVPAPWGQDTLRPRLKAVVERALSTDSTRADLDERMFEALASEACHSAIRAGDQLQRPEALELMNQLFLCENPWNCPHGRPTVVKVPQLRFEEWFQRKL